MAFEFGHTEQDERSPVVAMLFSGSLFVAGSLPSIIPFFCTSNVATATYVVQFLLSILDSQEKKKTPDLLLRVFIFFLLLLFFF